MDGCKQGTDKMYRMVCREMDETCGNRNRHIFWNSIENRIFIDWYTERAMGMGQEQERKRERQRKRKRERERERKRKRKRERRRRRERKRKWHRTRKWNPTQLPNRNRQCKRKRDRWIQGCSTSQHSLHSSCKTYAYPVSCWSPHVLTDGFDHAELRSIHYISACTCFPSLWATPSDSDRLGDYQVDSTLQNFQAFMTFRIHNLFTSKDG